MNEETLCCCVKCGPPWRNDIPRPDREENYAGWLTWSSWIATCPRCGYKRCDGAINHENPCNPDRSVK